jgi:hypothetical protein
VYLILLLFLMALWVVSCAPGSETPETVSVAASPDGMVGLAWMPGSDDPSVIAYFVHYGTESPGVQGSCDYAQSQYVEAPQTETIITGLTPGTQYFFTVAAYNGLESLCSEEVSHIDQ